ncbi:MAG: family 20 glycosylhydrolase [Clostridia bacterium]|nr:family 20 glycosylhydrolase [Clostridia bacterium]
MFKNKKALKIAAFISIIALLTTTVAIVIFSAETPWSLNENTRIYWVKDLDAMASSEELDAQIKFFSEELAANVTGSCLPIYYGSSADNAGEYDIVLTYASDISTQGYKVALNGNRLVVSASDTDGLFYGCRYVIKQLKAYDGKVSAKTDSPDVLERGLSLDNGRKYYSVDWIKEMIRELSWADMNTLVLHFSEEMGWGIESKLYPNLAGRDGTLCTQAEVATDNTSLTQDEIREIVEYADIYHVEIIPSIDSPGHLNYLVKWFNEQCASKSFSFISGGKTYTAPAGTNIGNYFSYNGQTTAVVPGSRNGNYSRGIDISNEIAVAFVESLIEEYGTLFNELGCYQFDIGGDELLGWGAAVTSSVPKWKQLDHWKEYAQRRTGDSNAVAYDAFLLYMNDLNDLVRSLGYTSVRMWNDDALRSSDTGWDHVVELDTDIDIWFWTTGTNKVSTYINAGYEVYNILSDYNYYAMTSDYFSDNRGGFDQSYPDQIYNEWTPYTFGSGGNTENGVLGSAFGIWSDNPTLRTEARVMADVLPMLRAHGAKAWDAKANESMSYSAFEAYLSKIGNCAVSTATAPAVVDVTALEAAVAEFSGMTSAGLTASSWAAYESAVKSGEAILASTEATQTNVNSAIASINNAKKALAPGGVFASFKTTRVRNGGTAVMRIEYAEANPTFELFGPDGNKITDFEVVTLDGEANVYYLKFNVSGRGKQTYTVTVNGDSATADLKLWK